VHLEHIEDQEKKKKVVRSMDPDQFKQMLEESIEMLEKQQF
jgi:hypothetical protein